MTRNERVMFDFQRGRLGALAGRWLRVTWAARKAVKWLAVPLRINDRLIESCQVCGIQQPVRWHAPHAVWASVAETARSPGGAWGGGVYCPRCFDERATSRGISLCWVPMYNGDDLPLLNGSGSVAKEGSQ